MPEDIEPQGGTTTGRPLPEFLPVGWQGRSPRWCGMHLPPDGDGSSWCVPCGQKCFEKAVCDGCAGPAANPPRERSGQTTVTVKLDDTVAKLLAKRYGRALSTAHDVISDLRPNCHEHPGPLADGCETCARRGRANEALRAIRETAFPPSEVSGD